MPGQIKVVSALAMVRPSSDVVKANALCLLRLPADLQVELTSCADGCAQQHPSVGRKGERNFRKLVYTHARRDTDRRYLGDVRRPLANNMAPQYFGGFAVGDQLAKTKLAAVDNRSRRRVEVHNH